jgi:hypothetical protein
MFSSEFGGTCRERNNLQGTLKNEMPIGMGILFFKILCIVVVVVFPVIPGKYPDDTHWVSWEY